MGRQDMGEVIAEAWETALRETARGDWTGDVYAALTGARMPTYRERLDRPRVNWYGEVIPRIALVRRNLRLLGKPARRPRLP